jgi:ABC-type molybdenum transport system ATPase subunit/photorepair protein PhrA
MDFLRAYAFINNMSKVTSETYRDGILTAPKESFGQSPQRTTAQRTQRVEILLLCALCEHLAHFAVIYLSN